MATSGSTDFSLNRNEIINMALGKIGVATDGETLSAEDLTLAARNLNLLIKGWQQKGIGLWLNKEATIFLESSKQYYDLGPSGDHCTLSYTTTALSSDGLAGESNPTVDSISGISDGDYIGIILDDNTIQWTTVNGTPAGSTVILTAALTGAASTGNAVYAYTSKISRPLEILEGRYVTSAYERPLNIISRDQYRSYSTVGNTGTAVDVYFDPQRTNARLYVWQAETTAGNFIEATFKMPIEDFDAAVNDPDFPQDWLNCLVYNLAVQCMPDFRIDPQRNQFVIAEANRLLFDALSFDSESASLEFSPELDSYYR